VTVVRIPPTLRVETGDRRDVEVAGSTVREVLETLVETFPGLDGRVLQDGRLQSFVNVYLDGADVETYDGLETAVSPDSTLLLLPAMAGGSFEPEASSMRSIGRRPARRVRPRATFCRAACRLEFHRRGSGGGTANARLSMQLAPHRSRWRPA
jgi:molybdopterin synthase sulfur carrier subunit